MDRLFVFVIRNDIWIYVLSFLGLIWYLGELIRARRFLRSAIFGLERERGQRMQRRAALFVVLFSSIIALVTYVNLQVAPTLPDDLLRPPTPTPNIFATPFSSPALQGDSQVNGTSTLAVAPTVTLPNSNFDAGLPALTPGVTPQIEETETRLPNIDIGNCSTDIAITAPPSGVSVGGNVTIFGTVNPQDLEFYDLEIYGPSTEGRWISVFEDIQTEPVIDDILATVDFQGLESGEYFVRLAATATNGEVAGHCAIQISLE